VAAIALDAISMAIRFATIMAQIHSPRSTSQEMAAKQIKILRPALKICQRRLSWS